MQVEVFWGSPAGPIGLIEEGCAVEVADVECNPGDRHLRLGQVGCPCRSCPQGVFRRPTAKPPPAREEMARKGWCSATVSLDLYRPPPRVRS